ncbi:MAG: gliding motility lipoprotein GldB [Bacteroidia bacterium]
MLFASCKTDRWKADTESISVNTHITRFEKILFELDTNQWQTQFTDVKTRHRDLTELMMERVFTLGRVDNPHAQDSLKGLITNVYFDSVYQDIQKIYTDAEIKKLEESLEEPFKRWKYYYPKDSIPQVYTSISGFNFQVVTYEKSLCIFLDMFLGENYRYYDFPEYIKRRLSKEYILPEVLKTVFMAKYNERQLIDQTMLSSMIYAGKMLYFTEAMAPDIADTVRIGYTKKQLGWCEENEALMWQHLTGENILYTTDQYLIMKYLKEAPFTAAEGVPNDSAPRLGEWVGWQIVRKYMDENKDVTLDQLFKDKDYKKILQKSKYKPK